MESENVNGKVAISSENSHVSPDKKLRSPSHSSSSSDEVVQLGSPGTNAGVGKGEHTGEEISVSPTPDGGQPSDGSAPPIPPAQAGGFPSETSDRIPAYVFARTNTASPMEWSVASNESLFSIHMGNMSFSREQLCWMSKSGELGYCSDHSTLSGPLPDIPSNTQTPTEKSTEIAMKTGDLNEDGYGVNEAAAAETMREVLRQNESQQKDNIAKESPFSRSLSQHSDASVKSFAFPILTGDHADKSGSLRKSTRNKNQLSRPSTPKATPQSPSDTAKTQTPPETPKPQSPPETPKPETTKSQTSKATRNAETRRWFSCFSCCPSCF